jgi:hypothetical protein
MLYTSACVVFGGLRPQAASHPGLLRGALDEAHIISNSKTQQAKVGVGRGGR